MIPIPIPVETRALRPNLASMFCKSQRDRLKEAHLLDLNFSFQLQVMVQGLLFLVADDLPLVDPQNPAVVAGHLV